MGNGYPTIPTDELSALRDRLQTLSDRVAELERPSGTQTADLLSTYKANQISPAGGEASASNFASSSTYVTYASFNLTVPAGYTRALIIGSGFANLGTNSGGADRNFCRVLIGGNAGPESIGYIYSVSGPSTAFHTLSLTGLVAGASIAVEVQAHLQVGANNALFQQWNTATVIASALFLS